MSTIIGTAIVVCAVLGVFFVWVAVWNEKRLKFGSEKDEKKRAALKKKAVTYYLLCAVAVTAITFLGLSYILVTPRSGSDISFGKHMALFLTVGLGIWGFIVGALTKWVRKII